MRNLIIILFCLFGLSETYGQLGGMRAYAGISTLINRDVVANPEGQTHSGYHFGADGRLMSGRMSFIVGVRYTAVSLRPTESFKLSGHMKTISVMNGRVGLDFNIVSLGRWVKIRTKALGSFDIVLNTTRGGVLPPGYKLNDGWLGLVTGLGFDLGPATLDLEYEYGIINAYNQKKGSAFDSFTLSAGFFF